MPSNDPNAGHSLVLGQHTEGFYLETGLPASAYHVGEIVAVRRSDGQITIGEIEGLGHNGQILLLIDCMLGRKSTEADALFKIRLPCSSTVVINPPINVPTPPKVIPQPVTSPVDDTRAMMMEPMVNGAKCKPGELVGMRHEDGKITLCKVEWQEPEGYVCVRADTRGSCVTVPVTDLFRLLRVMVHVPSSLTHKNEPEVLGTAISNFCEGDCLNGTDTASVSTEPADHSLYTTKYSLSEATPSTGIHSTSSTICAALPTEPLYDAERKVFSPCLGSDASMLTVQPGHSASDFCIGEYVAVPRSLGHLTIARIEQYDAPTGQFVVVVDAFQGLKRLLAGAIFKINHAPRTETSESAGGHVCPLPLPRQVTPPLSAGYEGICAGRNGTAARIMMPVHSSSNYLWHPTPAAPADNLKGLTQALNKLRFLAPPPDFTDADGTDSEHHWHGPAQLEMESLSTASGSRSGSEVHVKVEPLGDVPLGDVPEAGSGAAAAAEQERERLCIFVSQAPRQTLRGFKSLTGRRRSGSSLSDSEGAATPEPGPARASTPVELSASPVYGLRGLGFEAVATQAGSQGCM